MRIFITVLTLSVIFTTLTADAATRKRSTHPKLTNHQASQMLARSLAKKVVRSTKEVTRQKGSRR